MVLIGLYGLREVKDAFDYHVQEIKEFLKDYETPERVKPRDVLIQDTIGNTSIDTPTLLWSRPPGTFDTITGIRVVKPRKNKKKEDVIVEK